MKKTLVIILYLFLCSFSISHAAVEIREVMYNPEGSDTNREWIEIYNSGSSVDISSWYFFENDTYHGLYPEGFSSLENGERALIVKDVATAQSELGSGLRYIKSSFSLNNTGESLVIANAEKSHIDTYNYSVDDGGNGDGNSLQLVNSSWISANSTPGSINSSSGESNDNDNNEDSSNTDNNTEENVSFELYYIPNLEISDIIVAQSDFDIHANVTYVTENRRTKELDGYYYINFGDGNIMESDKRIDGTYRYRSSGNYIIVFEYYSSKLAFEYGENPNVLLKRNISVTDHNLEIISVNSFDGVTLKNDTNVMVDLSSWKIIWGNHKYTFPRYSYFAAGEKMSILFDTLGFSPQVDTWNNIQLLSNAHKPVDYFPKTIKKKRIKYSSDSEKTQNKIVESESSDFDNLSNTNSDFFGKPDSYLEQYLYDNPNKLEVDFGTSNNDLITANVHNAKGKSKNNNSIYYALGSLVLILGAARFTKHKNDKENLIEKKEDFGTIEIIE